MLDEYVIDAGIGSGQVFVPGVTQVGYEIGEDVGAAGGDEAVEADGEGLVRDAAPAEERRQEAEEREGVVRGEEAEERQEVRLEEPAGHGGGAAEDGRGGGREAGAREADEERGEGGGGVREPALPRGGVEEVERALPGVGGGDEAGEVGVVDVPRRRGGGRRRGWRWRRGRGAGGAAVQERGDPRERGFGGRRRRFHGQQWRPEGAFLLQQQRMKGFTAEAHADQDSG